jgi:nucleoid DNA-binding protein
MKDFVEEEKTFREVKTKIMVNTVIKRDLAKMMSGRTGYAFATSLENINAFIECVEECLLFGSNVQLREFGEFYVEQIPASKRFCYGKTIFVPKRRRPAFKYGAKLKAKVRRVIVDSENNTVLERKKEIDESGF